MKSFLSAVFLAITCFCISEAQVVTRPNPASMCSYHQRNTCPQARPGAFCSRCSFAFNKICADFRGQSGTFYNTCNFEMTRCNNPALQEVSCDNGQPITRRTTTTTRAGPTTRISNTTPFFNFTLPTRTPIMTRNPATTTPLYQPIMPPAVCAETRDVFTANGNYLRSLCLMTTSLNHNLANINCLNNRMQLYQLDSVAARAGLMDFANSHWTTGAILHTAGRNNAGQCSNIHNRGGTFVQGFGDCAQSMWSVCQFINIAPSQPQEPIPTPAVCAEARDMFTVMGVYLKSFCFIPTPLNYNAATANCVNHRMQLFQIDTTEERVGLFQYANERFTQSGSVMHVNGTNNAGQCANINNQWGMFIDDFGDCMRMIWSFCQYINISPTPGPVPI